MRVFVLAIIALLVAACAPAEPPQPSQDAQPAPAEPPAFTVLADAEIPEAPLEEARNASKELMAQLKGKLLASMKEHGAAGSIEVCSQVAPEIAETVQTETMSVRRVTLKVRNPEDEPDAYERATLERLEALYASNPESKPGEVAEIVDMPGQGQVLRYMKPLYIAKPCLSCHGPAETLDEAVKARLAELYPEDRATGYEDGDLRGAVSVVAKLD